MIKIFFLIDELNIGGTERQLVWLCEKLPRDRFSPTIGVLRKTEYQQGLFIKTPIVNFKWQGIALLKNFKLICRIRNYLIQNEFDILQTQFVESEIYGSLAALSLKRKPKLIFTRRNLYHWIGGDHLRFRMGKFLAHHCEHILANSFAVREKCCELEAVPREKITVIQNAVDLERFAPLDSKRAKLALGLKADDFVVGLVGNWRPVKGITTFLSAAKIILEKIRTVRFVLAGQGPQEQLLCELAKKHLIKDRILFLKNHSDIPGAIAAMDVAVQSSLSESFSNVLLEYMAAGKPIVATSVGDTPAMIKHGKTGLLVHPSDILNLADSVIRIHENSEWAQSMAVQALKCVSENWSESQILSKYCSFYSAFQSKGVAE